MVRGDHVADDRRGVPDVCRNGAAARRHSRASKRTAIRCCASSAIIAVPPMPPTPARTKLSRSRPSTHAPTLFTQATWALARKMWDDAISIGEVAGFRNAQTVVIAPTGCLTGNALISTDRGLTRLQRLGNVDGEQVARYRHSRAHRRRRTAREQVLYQWNLADAAHQDQQRLHDPGTPEHRVKIVDRQSGDLVWKRFAEVAGGRYRRALDGWLCRQPAGRQCCRRWAKSIGPPISRRRRRRNLTAELAEFVGYFMGAARCMPRAYACAWPMRMPTFAIV